MFAVLFSLALAAPPLAFDDEDGLHSAVVALGDVNGDGFDDFALGHRYRPFGLGNKPSEAWPAVSREDVVWILSGSDGTVLHVLSGGTDFGVRMANVGDLDGDGVSDLAASDSHPETQVDGVQRALVYGGSDRLEHARRVRIFSGATGGELATLNGEMDVPGFAITLSGGLQCVGDPTPDILVGGMGCAWLVDGASLVPAVAFRRDGNGKLQRLSPTGWNTPPLPADVPASEPEKWYDPGPFGQNVALVPDLDGDRLAEVVIGRPATVVFSSGTRASLSLESDGWCIAGGPDLDGDGFGDVVTTTVAHRVEAWSAATGERLWQISFDGGYMNGEGTSLAFTSDHDADGVSDLVLGANESHFDADTGFARVISGATGRQLKSVHASDLARLAKEDEPPGGQVGGLDVAPLGDLDGDGLEELVVQLPVLQEVRVLRGSDLSTLWTVDVRGLPRPEPPDPVPPNEE